MKCAAGHVTNTEVVIPIDNPILCGREDALGRVKTRLSVSEIHDVFKLARLTASFPNLVYIVACDRLQVEKALSEERISGHHYLEKIIQLPFNLSEAPTELSEKQLGAAMTPLSVIPKILGRSTSRHGITLDEAEHVLKLATDYLNE